MTVTHVETGYLEDPYLEDPYLGVHTLGYMGHQATFVIQDDKALGQQALFNIQNFPKSYGQQSQFQITGASKTLGQQAEFIIEALKPVGQQSLWATSANPAEYGMQTELHINNYPSARGMSYWKNIFAHLQCTGYLEGPYLEGPYLTENVCAHGAMQAEFLVTELKEFGMQAEFNIVDFKTYFGQQAEFVIDALKFIGQQAEFILAKENSQGQQTQIVIEDSRHNLGHQVVMVIDALKSIGMQVEVISSTPFGMQANIALYNTTNLRILCEFPSRGLSTAVGLNAWGFPAGVGNNWKSNSTAAGDFSPFNLNTDIVEQVWRSTVDSSISLDCDTERPQGVFLDTLAILEHNITTSASITLVGSNDPTFGVIGVSIPLQARQDDPNIFYIAPELPNTGYRYWRLAIDDGTNPDGYIQIGTIVFGGADIFFGECFVDEVEYQLKDFTDSVQTEGFTNVNNSRAQKKNMRLDFRSLGYLRGNFRMMRNMFRHERTVLKCLWIPTPSPLDQEYTARFAMFSKMVQIPTERHNNKGAKADYVSFTIELDESK